MTEYRIGMGISATGDYHLSVQSLEDQRPLDAQLALDAGRRLKTHPQRFDDATEFTVTGRSRALAIEMAQYTRHQLVDFLLRHGHNAEIMEEIVPLEGGDSLFTQHQRRLEAAEQRRTGS